MASDARPFYPTDSHKNQKEIRRLLKEEENELMRVKSEMGDLIGVTRSQHNYISNLQKANIFLKLRIKEAETDNDEIKYKLGIGKNEVIPFSTDSNPAVVENDFKLVSIGTIEENPPPRVYFHDY
jgi:hypothetical protein